MEKSSSRKNVLSNWALTLSALGVVYGDIGTSPLYAINEIFFTIQKSKIQSDYFILGPISLVFWSMTLIISIKYLCFVLLADHDGEGGVFALYSRLHHFKNRSIRYLKIFLMLAAGLLIGESIITPAISVLSSVEGFAVYNPYFNDKLIYLAIIILTSLFLFQSRGSHFMGRLFGPLALIWFLMIGFFGLTSILHQPEILKAINPYYAFSFLRDISFHQGLIIMGSVMLVITGGEALFADMGHFGKSAIRKGWFLLVYPALLLSYFGQGAYLLSGKAIINNNLFFSLIPRSLLFPSIIIATLATIIASQALISGAFSLAAQAVALGLFPRLKIFQTHQDHAGQIYVPVVNWFLFFGTIVLVCVFKNSTSLASAYGLSVSGVMATTSLSMIGISILVWKWELRKALFIFIPILILELSFLISNMTKFLDGGFVPITLGIFFFIIMRIWRWGRKATYKGYNEINAITIKDLISIKEQSNTFIDKNVVLLVPKPLRSLDDKVPALVQLFYNRYGMFPKNLFLVEVVHRKVPFIHGTRHESYQFYRDDLKGLISSTTIHFGFMEGPNIEKVLAELAHSHQVSLPDDPNSWLVHVTKEKLIPPKHQSLLKKIRFQVFLFLRQITMSAHYYYGLGEEVNLSVDILPVKIND